MKKISKTGRRLLRAVCAGLGLTAAACPIMGAYGMPVAYGMPPDYQQEYTIRGRVKTKTDQPIKGIRIAAKRDEETVAYSMTDNTGFFTIYVPYHNPETENKFTLQFTDVDGFENGGFFFPAERIVEVDDNIMFLEPTIILTEAKPDAQ
jgi:putative lipoprotein (rSAM/lipoprotein system)